jgi:hypothetical protein
VRIDNQHAFLSDKDKTFEDFVNYGFDIKYEVNEDDLNRFFEI